MIETGIARSPEVIISHVKLWNMHAMIDIGNVRQTESPESLCVT